MPSASPPLVHLVVLPATSGPHPAGKVVLALSDTLQLRILAEACD